MCTLNFFHLLILIFLDNDDVIGSNQCLCLPTAEGRVENQKLNQTAALLSFG